MSLSTWALPQIARLLPIDEDSLKQIIVYSDTLPKDAAAEHLKNLLGDSSQALEFITSFNSRRQKPPSESQQAAPSESNDTLSAGVPRPKPRQQNKQRGSNFRHLPPPRQPDSYGNTSGGYVKKTEEDYMSAKSKSKKDAAVASNFVLQDIPDAQKMPKTSAGSSRAASTNASPKLPPSAAGPLISDSRPSSRKSSRNASPAPNTKTKVNIAGGTSMHGQSSTINDLDSAIRALEIQTNPSVVSTQEENKKRRCTCMATRHPLLEAAPNCLNCGKIICVKEGIGPCTFCSTPLLSNTEIQAMVRVLRDERGREKQEANNAAHKRADIASIPRPFSSVQRDQQAEQEGKLAAAKEHRDKLLGFQAQNARRTKVHDEAADFDTPTSGLSMWASPQERAMQLKRQQKALREQEWANRPEWEKKKMVASIDLVGGKVLRRMAAAEKPEEPPSEDEDDHLDAEIATTTGISGGAFSKNPLLASGHLIRPIWKGATEDKGKGLATEKKSTWRRVQDDADDNEQWILDGGIYGDNIDGRVLGAEEHAQG
ncbi:MAG: hypothetical protein M1820_010539 [Bogoriella megaspora]|nr:MAG: hypothetical protein M1820_010539 [Bogoriella megaspora]